MERYKCLFALVTIVIAGAFLGKIGAQPMPSGTLPVFYLDTYNGEEIKKPEQYSYNHATFRLDTNGREGLNPSSGSIVVSIVTDLSTSNEQKKSIAFQLDFKADLIGTGKGELYCLLPYTEDRYAFLCHAVGFELSRRMGLAWTPRLVPVELVLNGEYWGIYFLTEQLEVGPNRVNIERLHNVEFEISLHVFDLYYASGGWLINNSNNAPMDGPKVDYLNSLYYNLTRRTIPEIPNSDEWEKYIDIDTLACYYIVNELMDNIKAFHYNCWMYKHRGEDKKLLFGPVWDFGTAFTRDQATMDFIYDHVETDLRVEKWMSKIRQSPRFQECLRKHYAEFKEKNGTDLDAFIDDFIDEIEAGVQADLKRWPSLGKPNLRAEAQQFKRVFRAKEAFLDSRWLNK